MDQTKSQHPNSMVLGSAKLEITKSPVTIDRTKKDWSLQQDLLDLGLARGVKISFESSKIDIKADNGTVPIKGLTDVKAKVEFSLLERHIPDIAIAMAGLVNVKKTGGEDEIKIHIGRGAATAELVGTKLVFYASSGFDPTVFENNKNRKFIVTGMGTRSDGCDVEFTDTNNKYQGEPVIYKDQKLYITECTTYIKRLLEVDDNAFPSQEELKKALLEKKKNNEEPKIELGVGGEFNCAVTFPATPEIYQLTKGSGGVAQPIAMKLTNKRQADDGRIITRTFELPYGFYTGDDSITLKSKNDTDNIAEIPMSFEFTPHPDMVDDNELSEMSLYREIAEL